MKKTQAIILVAGQGTRLADTGLSKPLLSLNGQPMLGYTLQAFEQSAQVHSVIVVAQAGHLTTFTELIRARGFKKVTQVVPGGARRRDSAAQGMAALDDDTAYVLIHDGARPLIRPAIIDAAIAACSPTESVVVGVPVTSTIKVVEDLKVQATLPRAALWEIQTPQVFLTATLRQAHAQAQGATATDDAMLVERLGKTVRVVRGDTKNLKITTKEDIMMAEALLRDDARPEDSQQT